MQLIERVKREDNKRIFKFAKAKRQEFYDLIIILTTTLENKLQYIEINSSDLGIARWGCGGSILLCQQWENEAEASVNGISKKLTASLLKAESDHLIAKSILNIALKHMQHSQLRDLVERFCHGSEEALYLTISEFVVEQVKDLASSSKPEKPLEKQEAEALNLNRIDDIYLSVEIDRLKQDNLPLKEFAARLSEITKKKVADHYQIAAEAMTKKSLVNKLSIMNIAPHIRGAIDEILTFCENAIYANRDYSKAEIAAVEKSAAAIVKQLEAA